MDRRVKLDLIHGFGSSTSNGYRDSASIIDTDNKKQVLFPLSKYIGVKNLEQNDMSFIKLPDTMKEIACLTVSPNKKFLAVCCKSHSNSSDVSNQIPSVTVYDIKAAIQKNKQQKKNNRTFPYADSTVQNFSALAFSADSHNRFLLCLTEAPENKLVFIDIVGNKKNYASQVINQPINKISISPNETHLVAISGPGIFKILRVQESSFVYICENIRKLSQNQNFTDHTWFDENRIAIANDKGEIFTIYNNEVESHFHTGLDQLGSPITTIKSFSKGLICGGDRGNFSVWIKNENPQKVLERKIQDEKYELVQLTNWSSERGNEVVSIDVSSNDSLMAVAFKNNDVATYDLSKLSNVASENYESMQKKLRLIEKKLKFKYIYEGSHFGAITSMDVCVQRPLIVTCSNQDSTIRIWNYMNFKCELKRKFEFKEGQKLNPLLSVAFHPSGYYIAAGFIDMLRIYHVLKDSLKLFQEIQIKSGQIIQFSQRGAYLAVSHPRQNLHIGQHQVTIFDSYTLECVKELKDPGNKISDLLWTPNDNSLLVSTVDGKIYEYEAYKIWNKKDRLLSNTSISTILFNERTNVITAAGGEDNKGHIKEILDKEDGDSKTNQLDEQLPYRLSRLAYLTSYFNQGAIIGGTSEGQIKVWSHIIHLNQMMPFETIASHQGEITQLKVSPNGRYVFSSGQDGIIFIYQVTELTKDGEILTAKNNPNIQKEQINPKALCVDETLADVVMVQKQDIEDIIKEKQKASELFIELKKKGQDDLDELKQKHAKMLKDFDEQKQKDIKKLQDDLNNLSIKKDSQQKKYKQLLQEMEEGQLDQVRELDRLYEAKLAYENEKYLQQESELQQMKAGYEKKIKEIEKKNDKAIMLLKSEFIDQFSKVNRVYTNTKDTAVDIKKTYEERLSQLEEEHELEINSMVNKQDELEKKWNDQLLEKTKKITELTKDKQQALQLKDKFENEVKKQDETIQQLEEKVQDLKEKLKSEEGEKLRKEGVVKEKDKSINNLKYKISDLQKTKHVLSFRTTEMRKSLEPKEAQIEKLKEELFKLEHEFQQILKNYQQQNDVMKKMQNQIDTLNNNLQKEEQAKKKIQNTHNKMVMDLHNIVKKNDYHEYIKGLTRLYQEYVQDIQLHQGKQDPKSIEEMTKMIQQLEKSIFQINKTQSKEIYRREQEVHLKIKNNADLIYDLNDIRKENKELKAELQNQIIINQTQEKENKKLEQEIKKISEKLNKKKFTQSAQQMPVASDLNSLGIGSNLKPNISLTNNNTFNNNNSDQKQQNNQPYRPILQQKGAIFKGSNYDLKTQGFFDKSKMLDLMAEVELSNQRRTQAEQKLINIKKKIKHHINAYQCHDNDLQQESQINEDLDLSSGGIKLPNISRQ